MVAIDVGEADGASACVAPTGLDMSYSAVATPTKYDRMGEKRMQGRLVVVPFVVPC